MNRDKSWQILDTGMRSAEENMQIDAGLLDDLMPGDQPILHFYDWKKGSATYGHFVNPSDFLDLAAVEREGIELAKRPTGGGIVFHIWDLAFSVLVPSKHENFSENTLENYAFVNNSVLLAVQEFLATSDKPKLIKQDARALDPSCSRFCMAQPTKYDVVLEGRKIAGAAQRKRRNGFLHQGTIALKMPSKELLTSVLKPETKVLEAMMANTFALIEEEEDLVTAREKLKALLQTHITKIPAHVTKK